MIIKCDKKDTSFRGEKGKLAVGEVKDGRLESSNEGKPQCPCVLRKRYLCKFHFVFLSLRPNHLQGKSFRAVSSSLASVGASKSWQRLLPSLLFMSLCPSLWILIPSPGTSLPAAVVMSAGLWRRGSVVETRDIVVGVATQTQLTSSP